MASGNIKRYQGSQIFLMLTYLGYNSNIYALEYWIIGIRSKFPNTPTLTLSPIQAFADIVVHCRKLFHVFVTLTLNLHGLKCFALSVGFLSVYT